MEARGSSESSSSSRDSRAEMAVAAGRARRLHAYLAHEPEKKVLLSIAPGATSLDELLEQAARKLGQPRVAAIFLGEPDVRVVDPDDLADGDGVRCVVADAAAGAAPEPPPPARPWWFEVARLALMLVIFVSLSEGFQRLVFRPMFQPAARDGDDGIPVKVLDIDDPS